MQLAPLTCCKVRSNLIQLRGRQHQQTGQVTDLRCQYYFSPYFLSNEFTQINTDTKFVFSLYSESIISLSSKVVTNLVLARITPKFFVQLSILEIDLVIGCHGR